MLVDKRIKENEGMIFNEFDMRNIEKAKREDASEVKERWGNSDAYKESERKTSGYDADKWSHINGGAGEIFRKFSNLKGSNPGSNEVQSAVKEWQDFITDNFYTCTKEILVGLGIMYTADERFQINIDSYGEGTAKLMSDAIEIYCSKE